VLNFLTLSDIFCVLSLAFQRTHLSQEPLLVWYQNKMGQCYITCTCRSMNLNCTHKVSAIFCTLSQHIGSWNFVYKHYWMGSVNEQNFRWGSDPINRWHVRVDLNTLSGTLKKKIQIKIRAHNKINHLCKICSVCTVCYFWDNTLQISKHTSWINSMSYNMNPQ
jgi:hypothetical protein